jgi:hypothetical protein
MAHRGALNVIAAAPGPSQTVLRDLFYKADRPRPIDAYIDFFGDGAKRPALADCCGELLLGSLA